MQSYRSTLCFFGAGGITLGVVGNAVTYFMLIYYNQVLGLPAAVVSAALAIALVFDAFSDPLVGMISDRTRTRLGRRHPFIYFSLLPLPLLYFLLWNPPDWALASNSMGLLYLTAVLIVFRTVMTCYDIPSNAMIPELTSDYDQRTSLMSARISTAWVAGVSFTILMYAVYLQPTETQPDGALNQAGYVASSYLGAGLILLSILAASAGTHRHIPQLRRPRETNSLSLVNALATVKEVITSKAFRTIISVALVLRASDGLMAAIWIYIMTFFWIMNTDQIAFLSVMNLLGALGAMFALPRLARLTDKRNIALAANAGLLLTGCLPLALRLAGIMPDSWVWPVLVGASALDTFFWVMLISLMASMLTDVVEDVQSSGGLRHEGAIVSAQTFVGKLSTAAGTWLAGMVLTLIAFPQMGEVAAVPDSARNDLALTYLSVYVISISIGMALLLRFKLNRAQHQKNLNAVAAGTSQEAAG